jgi:hypothetical protein
MGNTVNSDRNTPKKNEKLFSSEEINIGMRKLNSQGEKRRLSATNLNVRSQYFNKILQNNRKESEEWNSIKEKGSLRNSVNIFGIKANKKLEESENCPFDDAPSYHNSSLIEPFHHSNPENYEDFNSSNTKVNRISLNNKKNNRISIKRNDYIRRSLSAQTQNQLSSFSNSNNSLILNNDQDHEINIYNLERNLSIIDIKNKRKKNYISNSSDDVLSIGKSSFVEEKLHREDSNYDKVSIISNLYSLRNSIINTNDYELNFIKNGEDLRRSYIAKLIYKKIWPSEIKEKTHNSMIIFDWDDTLLCTSFLTPNGIFNEDLELTDKEKEKLAKLEFNVLRILKDAIEKGDTYIITNAAPGWVEYSAERFYPSVKTMLDKVKIISARGDYENIYPGDSRMWKIQAFLNMQKNFDSNLVTNILCLGDSFIEMEAGHVLASKFSQAFIKTVKFRESPKPEELNKQLSLVAEQFPAIFSAVKNLTIRVEKKAKK